MENLARTTNKETEGTTDCTKEGKYTETQQIKKNLKNNHIW